MQIKTRVVAPEILKLLHQVDLCEDMARIPARVGKLDRKLYLKLNEVLEAAGGKWVRKHQAHVFPGEAVAALEPILLTGTFQRDADYGFFETPAPIVKMIMARANIQPGDDVLEPSAGTGNIAVAALGKRPAALRAIELQGKHAVHLKARTDAVDTVTKRHVTCGDFLQQEVEARFDSVVMNPPFSRQQDLVHIMRARKFLRRGGRLVSVAAQGCRWRRDGVAMLFREMVTRDGGSIEDLPEKAFKVSGTTVNTVLVTIPA